MNARPILLVPGMSGSVLVNRQRPTRHLFHKEILDNRWLNIRPLLPKHTLQWKEDMAMDVRRDPVSRVIIGFKDYSEDIVPYDVGGVRGITNLVGEFDLLGPAQRRTLQTRYMYRYFGPLVDDLVCRGAVVGRSLFGFPYDFRLFLDPERMAAMFRDLRHWVQEARRLGPVVVVTHSLGGLLFKLFLTSFVSQEWIDEHVGHWICVNAPLGGTPLAAKAVVYGEYFIPSLAQEFRDELQKCSGIVMCLPNSNVKWDERPFAADLTIGSYNKWAERNIAFEIWKDLARPRLAALARPVDVRATFVISSGVPTMRTFNDEPRAMVKGDGVIPQASLNAMVDTVAPSRRTVLQWKYTTHINVLQEPRLMDLIWTTASQI